MENTFEIEVLADGTAKVTTGSFSPEAHVNADKLMDFLARNLGGEVVVEKNPHAHAHTHTHGRLTHRH